MNTGSFPESNIKIAEDQPEYNTIEALSKRDQGSVVYCLDLSLEELARVVSTGRIWVEQLTGGGPIQPMYFTTNKDEVVPKNESNG